MATPAVPETLVLIRKDGHLHQVDPQAKAFLTNAQNANRSIVPVVMAGGYRTGKSTALGLLVKKPATSFQVGSTVNACTRGIHMCTTFMENPSDPGTGILIMDTEGLGAPTSNHNQDTNLFVLALLLSKVLILNLKGAIDQTSLDTLKAVGNISKMLRPTPPSSQSQSQNKRQKIDDSAAAAAAAASANNSLSDVMPAVLVCVRDFALKLTNPAGESISEDEYLEQAIVHVPDGDADKNETRRAFRELFPRRTCLTMCRPTADDDLLKVINTQPETAFNPKFLEQIETLRRMIFMYAKPPHMTGSMLVSMAEQYCDALNSKRVPMVRDVWENVYRQQCQAAVDEATQIFRTTMEKSLAKADTKAKLEGLIAMSFDKALERFHELAVGDSSASLKDLRKSLNSDASEHRKKLVEKLGLSVAAEIDKDVQAENCASMADLQLRVTKTVNALFTKFGRDDDTRNVINTELAERQLVWACKVWERDHKALRDELNKAESRWMTQEDELKFLRESEKTALAKLTDLEACKTTTINDLEAQLQSSTEQLQDATDKLADAEQWKPMAQAANERLRNIVMDNERLRADHGDLARQMESIVEENKRLASEKRQAIEQQAHTVAELQSHIDNVMADMRNANENNVARTMTLQTELTAANNRIKALQQEVQSTQSASADALAKLKKEMDSERKQAITSQEGLISTYQNKIEALDREHALALGQRERELQMQIQAMQTEVALVRNMHEKNATELARMQGKLTDALTAAAQLKADNRALSTQHAKDETELASLQVKLELCEAAVSKLRDSSSEAERKVAAITDKMRQTEQRHEAETMKSNLRTRWREQCLQDALLQAGGRVPPSLDSVPFSSSSTETAKH